MRFWKKIKKLAQIKSGGFNMIEILIMISLLVITFVAVMSLIIKNVQMEYIIKNDFIAMSLAKEGIELVEQIRNDNLRTDPNLPFLDIYNPVEGVPKIFRIDYYSGRASIFNLVGGLDNPASVLKFNDTDYYQHTSPINPNPDSQFKRMITTVYYNEGQTNRYLKVTSTVAWENKGQRYTYDISTFLFDDNYNINPF